MVPVSPFLFVVEFVRHQLRCEDVAVGHLSLACFLSPRLPLFRGADRRKVEVWKNRRLCRETCQEAIASIVRKYNQHRRYSYSGGYSFSSGHSCI